MNSRALHYLAKTRLAQAGIKLAEDDDGHMPTPVSTFAGGALGAMVGAGAAPLMPKSMLDRLNYNAAVRYGRSIHGQSGASFTEVRGPLFNHVSLWGGTPEMRNELTSIQKRTGNYYAPHAALLGAGVGALGGYLWGRSHED